MKLEAGQFVRTKDGIIAKVDYIDGNTIFFDKDLYRTYGDSIDFLEKDNLERIVKASYNIIDILEIGDYVNGRKVYQVGYNFQDDFVLKMSKSNYDDFIYPNEIETIVTHDQMEQMEYKVGE